MSYDPQYAQPGGAPAAQGTNTMAILSLVFAFLFWPLGIVFGHVAKGQIRRTGEGGNGLATAGMVLGYIALGITVLVIIIGVAGVAAAGTALAY